MLVKDLYKFIGCLVVVVTCLFVYDWCELLRNEFRCEWNDYKNEMTTLIIVLSTE